MILFLCALPLLSEIKTIHSLEEISVDAFSEKTLIMFDLDDVLVYPQDALLQNWRCGWKPEGIRAWTAEEDTIAWMHADFQLMDPYGPRFLDMLYERGIPTIGFTSFAMDQSGIVESIPTWRTQHLNKLGLHFREKGEVVFPIEEGFIPPSFEKGLLHCGNRYKKDKDNKGKILSLYLDWIDWTPEQIVFVEDDRKHLESVSRELDKRKIPFLGLHYIPPKNLDPINEQVAKIQHQAIIDYKWWIPDRNALSGVITCNNILDIQTFVRPSPSNMTQTLALIDFDDTLVMSGVKEASHLGGPAWRKDFRKYLEELKEAKSITSADLLFGCVTLFIAKSLPAQAVQILETAKLIEALEAMGCKVMIFTARGRSGENAWYKLCVSGVDTFTNEQLEQSDIDFCQDLTFPEHPNVFEGRMIFSQNQPKEDLLSELIEEKIVDPTQYHQIIFIDDKKDSVIKLGTALEARQIFYTGIHYTHVEDVEKGEYDLMKSTIHLAHLLTKHVLPTPRELENIQTQLREQGTSPAEFFKQTLIKIDEALNENGVYQEKGLNTQQLFERIKQAIYNSTCGLTSTSHNPIKCHKK